MIHGRFYGQLFICTYFEKRYIHSGDVNSPESDALNELCSSLNLFQLIKEPTRVTLQFSSLIDVILTSNTSLIAESGVEETHISDHFLVYSILKFKLRKQLPDYVVTRSFKNYSSEAFKNDLEQLIWQYNSIDHDVNQRLDNFNQKFLSVLDMHAPIKTVKIKRRLCPFVGQEIVKLMKKRDALKPSRPWTGTDTACAEIKLKEN
jgi:hypothetical protein